MTAPANARARARPSLIVRILRTALRGLLFAFAFGFTVGTLIRCSAERASPAAIQYLGASNPDGQAVEPASDSPA